MNQNWTNFTGLTLEQTNDLAAVSRVFHPDDMANAFARWTRSLETGEPHEVQWRFRRASDGAYRWFLTRAVPFRGADGRVIEWFGTAIDIHEQKLAEERLRELDRRKDEFLATLGHELRNPLNPIIAAVQVLRRTGASSEQRARAGRARASAGPSDPAGPLLIALTGWGQEADQRAAREAGFDEHMTKPIDLSILSRLRAVLHRART